MSRPNKIARRQKEVRAMNHELWRLYRAKHSLGYLTLEKPIRHGWFKHLTLRDDVARREDAEVFREILRFSGMDIWGRDKKHADKVWTKENSRRNNCIQFPGIRKLHEKRYRELSNKAKKWYEGFDWYYSTQEGHVKRYYCRVPRYFFKITYTRAFITKKQIVDPELERKISEIEQRLISKEYFNYDIQRFNFRRYFNPMYHRVLRRKLKKALNPYDEDSFDKSVYQSIKW